MQRNFKLSDNKLEIQQVEIKMLQKLLAERDATIEELNQSIELQNNYVVRLEADYKDLFRELHFLSNEKKTEPVIEEETKVSIEIEDKKNSIDMNDPLFRIDGISDLVPASASASTSAISPNSDIEDSFHIIKKYE